MRSTSLARPPRTERSRPLADPALRAPRANKWQTVSADKLASHQHPVPRPLRTRFQRWMYDLQEQFDRPLMTMTFSEGEDPGGPLARGVVVIASAARPENERHGPIGPACAGCDKSFPVGPKAGIPREWVREFPKNKLPLKLRQLHVAGLLCPGCQNRIDKEQVVADLSSIVSALLAVSG